MINIAIDGPAGAGKSTVAKMVARRLGITYLDTGAMYRAAALRFDRMGVSMDDTAAICSGLSDMQIDISYHNGEQHIYLNGENVSFTIREHRISALASDISRIKEVRLKLVDLQRTIAADKDVIMDGRDIGTFVLPQARFKFFLTAGDRERARRRYEELTQKGQSCKYEDVLSEIKQRDHNDSTREFAPLKQAEDAVLIDSTNMDAEQVADFIVQKVTAAI